MDVAPRRIPAGNFLRLLIVWSGFPEPQRNCEIPLPAGTKRVRGDLVYFRYRVLVDYDGQQHRTDDLHDNRGIECLHDLRAALASDHRAQGLGQGVGTRRYRGRTAFAGWHPGV